MISTNKKGEWLEIIIPFHWNEYTIEQLFKDIWKAPKKLTHSLRMDKSLKLNSHLVPWESKLATGDKIQIRLFQEEDFSVIPEYHDIQILFEDEHLIVVNKPAYMDTHPNLPEQTNTLANAVAFHLQMQGEIRRVQHIHRLDRDTTGAILFAKHALAGSMLDKMLEHRAIKRTYLALVEGLVHKKKGTIENPIGRDRHHPTRRRVSPSGQHAVTHYAIVEKWSKQRMTLVKCQLDTGRTHQIRVHFSHLGHPLAGDELYGGNPTFQRQALHAVKLEFNHPITEERIVCHAPFLDEPPIFKNIDPYDM